MKKTNKSIAVTGQSLLDFIDSSPTPFHAAHELADRLASAGFHELQESDAWDLTAGGKYFVRRNDSSLIAVLPGTQPAEQAGFKIIHVRQIIVNSIISIYNYIYWIG